MPTSPRPTTWRLADLVELVTSGRLRVPAYQRGFVWDVARVLAAFRSVAQGLPLGVILVVRQPAPASTVHFGALEVEAPATDDALWLVDGHQRVAALAGALMAASSADDERFRIFYKLDDHDFHAVPPGTTPLDTWLPADLLLDDTALRVWYHTLTQTEMEEASVLAETFQSYRLQVYELDGGDVSATEIFERLNTGGVSLTAAEIRNARRPAQEPLRELAGQIRRLGFGIDDSTVLRYGRPIAVGARAAIRFLRTEGGIGHARLLPDHSAVPASALFMHRYGYPDARLAQLLRRWLWRRFVAADGVDLTAQLRRALADDPYDTLATLLGDTPDTPLPVPAGVLDGQPLGLLGLLSTGPLELATGEPVDAVGALRRQQSPLVPIFSDNGVDLSGLIVATDAPSDVLTALTAADSSIRSTHLIDDTAVDALLRGDRQAFLAHRGRSILAATQRLVDGMAEWGARGGRTLADLMRTVA